MQAVSVLIVVMFIFFCGRANKPGKTLMHALFFALLSGYICEPQKNQNSRLN